MPRKLWEVDTGRPKFTVVEMQNLNCQRQDNSPLVAFRSERVLQIWGFFCLKVERIQKEMGSSHQRMPRLPSRLDDLWQRTSNISNTWRYSANAQHCWFSHYCHKSHYSSHCRKWFLGKNGIWVGFNHIGEKSICRTSSSFCLLLEMRL